MKSATKTGHGPMGINYIVLAPHGGSWKLWSRHNTKVKALSVLDGMQEGAYRGAPDGSILAAYQQYGPYDFPDGYYASADQATLLDADDVYLADTWGD